MMSYFIFSHLQDSYCLNSVKANLLPSNYSFLIVVIQNHWTVTFPWKVIYLVPPILLLWLIFLNQNPGILAPLGTLIQWHLQLELLPPDRVTVICHTDLFSLEGLPYKNAGDACQKFWKEPLVPLEGTKIK